MRWAHLEPGDAWGELRGRAGRARDLNSLDAAVARGCREERPPWEMARHLGVDEPTVRRVIERLRRRGRSLDPDPATWTAADVEDELALRREEAARTSDPIPEDQAKSVVGETLRAHRRRLEMSQEELGDAAGFMGGRGLSYFEHRGPNFPITHLIRLAAALRIPCSALTERLRWDPHARTFLLARRRCVTERSPGAVIGRNARRIRQAARLPEEIVAARVGRRSNYSTPWREAANSPDRTTSRIGHSRAPRTTPATAGTMSEPEPSASTATSEPANQPSQRSGTPPGTGSGRPSTWWMRRSGEKIRWYERTPLPPSVTAAPGGRWLWRRRRPGRGEDEPADDDRRAEEHHQLGEAPVDQEDQREDWWRPCC
jgi:hypothetical protein